MLHWVCGRRASKRGLLALSIVCVIAGFAGVSPAYADPPPVEAYGRLPAVSDVSISPDGHKIVMAQSDATATAFRIIDLDTQQSLYAARIESPNRLVGVGWADDDHVTFTVKSTQVTGSMGVYVRGQTLLHYTRIGVYSLRSHRQVFMLQDIPNANLNTGLGWMVSPIDGDPGYGRMGGYQTEGESGRLVIYRVNLENGRSTVAERGDGEKADNYLLNSHGDIVARTDSDGRTNHWWLYAYPNGRPTLLREGQEETGASPDIHGLLPDGRLVASVPDADNNWHLVAMNTDGSGSNEELMPEHSESDCTRYDRWNSRVVGLCWDEDFLKTRFLDPDLQRVQQMVDELFSDGYGSIIEWSRDRSKFLVYGETASDGGGYYILDPAHEQLLQVGLRYPELTGANFGLREQITFPARDGTRIPAYLHLPVQNGRNLPLVLFVHGGPHARDTFDFDPFAAFFVSRGYAVLQVNFRGSAGYGRQWFTAGRGNWGDGVMQTDVIDGVDALVRQGIVDPHRVCIVGASYGGYSALAGATLTPDKFACAISIAGVSDLPLMLDNETAGAPRSGSAEWWRLSIGDPRADRDHLRAISPANLAANVRAPILLIHGDQDTTVPIAQSREMADRLQAAGKNFRLVVLQGEDHNLSAGPTRVQTLREMETFLAQYLGPGVH